MDDPDWRQRLCSTVPVSLNRPPASLPRGRIFTPCLSRLRYVLDRPTPNKTPPMYSQNNCIFDCGFYKTILVHDDELFFLKIVHYWNPALLPESRAFSLALLALAALHPAEIIFRPISAPHLVYPSPRRPLGPLGVSRRVARTVPLSSIAAISSALQNARSELLSSKYPPFTLLPPEDVYQKLFYFLPIHPPTF